MILQHAYPCTAHVLLNHLAVLQSAFHALAVLEGADVPWVKLLTQQLGYNLTARDLVADAGVDDQGLTNQPQHQPVPPSPPVKWLREQGGAPMSIFDMPPVLACDDVLALYPAVDALLMVASEGITERNNLSRALEMLTDVNLLGVVLNRTRERNKISPYY